MKKVMVRVTLPAAFPVQFSSSPGIAGQGETVLECEVRAKSEAEAEQKVRDAIKVEALHTGYSD